MASIPEYQRKQLASTYVGPAQRDDSAALAAGAIQEGVVEPPLKRALVEERTKKDAYTKMIANDSIVKYSLAAQEQLLELQKTYANDPKKYPEKGTEVLKTLADTYLEGIPDEDVKVEAANGFSTIQRAAISPMLSWVSTQQETKAKIATESALNSTMLACSSVINPETLKQNVVSMQDTIDGSSVALDIVARKDLSDKYIPKAVEASIYNRIMGKYPNYVLKDLQRGVYDKIPGFNSALKAEYISKADTRIRQQKQEFVAAQRATYEAGQNEVYAGTMTFPRIVEMQNSVDPSYSINPTQANNLVESMIPRIQAESNRIAKSSKEAAKYVTLAQKFIDNKLDQAEWLQELNNIWRDGVVMPNEAVAWNTLRSKMNTIIGDRDKNIFSRAMESVIDTAKTYYKNVPNSTLITAQALRDFMTEATASARQVNPEIIAQKVNTQLRLMKLGIKDSSKILKEGSTYRSNKGRVLIIYPPDKDGICQVKESN